MQKHFQTSSWSSFLMETVQIHLIVDWFLYWIQTDSFWFCPSFFTSPFLSSLWVLSRSRGCCRLLLLTRSWGSQTLRLRREARTRRSPSLSCSTACCRRSSQSTWGWACSTWLPMKCFLPLRSYWRVWFWVGGNHLSSSCCGLTIWICRRE
jgi:hypothetical protein